MKSSGSQYSSYSPVASEDSVTTGCRFRLIGVDRYRLTKRQNFDLAFFNPPKHLADRLFSHLLFDRMCPNYAKKCLLSNLI